MNRYQCVHARKGMYHCEAGTTYQAAQLAAAHWKLKSTSGIDVYLVGTDTWRYN